MTFLIYVCEKSAANQQMAAYLLLIQGEFFAIKQFSMSNAFVDYTQ